MEKAMPEGDTTANEQAAGPQNDSAVNRRDAFRGLAAAAAGAAVGVVSPAQAADQPSDACEVKNPYGGGPNTGITLPPYYRPTPSVANANTFFPGMGELARTRCASRSSAARRCRPHARRRGRRSWSSWVMGNAF